MESDGVNDIWAGDLLDMGAGSPKDNDGYRYILCLVDVYSRFAFVVPMKTKKAAEFLKAFKSVCEKQGVVPRRLWVDQGGEFVNRATENFLRSHDSRIYHTYSPHKVSIAERFNRTLRLLLSVHMAEENTLHWVGELLDKCVELYNNRRHSTIDETPAAVYSGKAKPNRKPLPEDTGSHAAKFEVGDVVRISRTKSVFEKEADHNWTRELFTVSQVRPTRPTTYMLKDSAGDQVMGAFYAQELLKSEQDPNLHLVDKVIKTDLRKKKQLVSWLGYPPSFNSWIDIE